MAIKQMIIVLPVQSGIPCIRVLAGALWVRRSAPTRDLRRLVAHGRAQYTMPTLILLSSHGRAHHLLQFPGSQQSHERIKPGLGVAAAQVEGSASAPAVIERLVRAAHPCSNACCQSCQRGEGNLRVSRNTRHPLSLPMAHTRSPVHNRVSVAQGPNCGLCAVPVLS